MKVLDFDTRSLIAKECIHIVCQAAEEGGDPSRGGGGRKSDKKITRMLGTVPVLDRSGSNVQLTITSLSLKLSHLDTGNVRTKVAHGEKALRAPHLPPKAILLKMNSLITANLRTRDAEHQLRLRRGH